MSERPPTIGRRALLQRGLVQGLAVAAVGAGLAGCTPDEEPPDPGVPPEPSVSVTPSAAENPFGVDPEDTLDLVAFPGRYGAPTFTALAALHTKAWGPGLRVTEAAKIESTLEPLFEADEPPDVFVNGGPESLPLTQAVAEGRLADLEPLLDAPTVDDPGITVRELLLPSVIAAGSVDGKVRELHYALAVWGLWHSSEQFDQYGWAPATTMDAFVDLLDDIAVQTSLPPLVTAGLHAESLATLLCHQGVKQGGLEVLTKLDNLEPDAWTQDPVFFAAHRWEEIAAEGWIHPDSAMLDQLAAEELWAGGGAALVPGASWLASEIELPDGLTPGFASLPLLAEDDQLPYSALGTDPGLPLAVCEAADNRAGGLEFLRTLLSEDGMRTFHEQTGSVCAVVGAADQVSDPSPTLAATLDAVAAAGEDLFDLRCLRWYGELRTTARDTTRRLLAAEITADQFVATMQQVTDRIAGDPTVTKFQRD